MRTRSLTLLALLLTAGLVACGDKAQSTQPDTTPDAFAFAALADQKPDSEVSSNAITVSGIDAPVPLPDSLSPFGQPAQQLFPE